MSKIDEISPALIQRHYMMMTATILAAAADNGVSFDVILARAVGAFGLVPTKADPRKYELLPQLRALADEAAVTTGAPALPQIFTEDEAVLFCACQTALLQIEGKLGEASDKLRIEAERMKARTGEAPTETKTSAIDKGRVPPQGDTGFDDDNNGGPTFH